MKISAEEWARRVESAKREGERDFEHCDIDRIWAHQALDAADRLIDWIEQNVAGADGELAGRIFAAIRKYGDFVAEHEKRLAADMAAWETRWHESDD